MKAHRLARIAAAGAVLTVLTLPAFLIAQDSTESDPQLTAEAVVANYLAARGGEDRWRQIKTIEMTGTYSAFSEESSFRWVGARGDHYRLDFELLGAPAVRARDAEGPWWRHKLINPGPGRLESGPYKTQVERESIFGPVLLDYAKRGISIELAGSGEVEGVPTINLMVTLPDGSVETWMFDSSTWLEVAIDSEVSDMTQGMAPMRQRAFFDDFRTVDGVVMPFLVDLEFGARLESMVVDQVIINPELAEGAFAMPKSEEGS